MSGEKEKGISFYFNGNLGPALYEKFNKEIEKEAERFLESPEGKKAIQTFVRDTIKSQIDRHFSYAVSDNPDYKRMQAIVTKKVMATLLKTIEGE